MHVAQLLDALVFGPDVEIIKAFLPDVLRSVVEQADLRGIPSSKHSKK
jgi:hypothetical protein